MASGPDSRLTRAAIFIRETFWVFALGAILGYLFFMVLGAYSPGDAAGLTIAVGVLAILWILHAWAGRRRSDDRRDPRIVEARERRGF
jgi:hypothetical protein